VRNEWPFPAETPASSPRASPHRRCVRGAADRARWPAFSRRPSGPSRSGPLEPGSTRPDPIGRHRTRSGATQRGATGRDASRRGRHGSRPVETWSSLFLYPRAPQRGRSQWWFAPPLAHISPHPPLIQQAILRRKGPFWRRPSPLGLPAETHRKFSTRFPRSKIKWSGAVWSRLEWSGVVWSGLDRFGVIWTALD